MYTVKVNVKSFSKNKEFFLSFLFFWLGLMLFNFILFISDWMKDTLDKYQFMVVILPLYIILSFLSIVPIVIVLRKKIKKYHNTYVNKEITFNVRGNNLYIGDTKLQIIKSLEDGKIYIDDFIINRLHIPSKGYINSYRVTFIGIIDKPYSDKFEEFMKSNDIKISFRKDKPNFF